MDRTSEERHVLPFGEDQIRNLLGQKMIRESIKGETAGVERERMLGSGRTDALRDEITPGSQTGEGSGTGGSRTLVEPAKRFECQII